MLYINLACQWIDYYSDKLVMANQDDSSAGTPSITLTFDDAPVQPETLRLTLRQKSMWKRFLELASEMNPAKLLEFIDSEKKRILQNVKERGCITQEEFDYLNNMTRMNLQKILDDFKEKCLNQMKVTPDDTPDEISFKTSFAEQLVEWLLNLFDWLHKKIEEIFSWIKKGVEWCVEQAKKLFEYLWKLFE